MGLKKGYLLKNDIPNQMPEYRDCQKSFCVSDLKLKLV